jgi:hypothetical protein
MSLDLLEFPDVPALDTPCPKSLRDDDDDCWLAGPLHPLYFYGPVRVDAQNPGRLPDVGGLVQDLHDLVLAEDVEIDIHHVEIVENARVDCVECVEIMNSR